jgi:hypothetical protein
MQHQAVTFVVVPKKGNNKRKTQSAVGRPESKNNRSRAAEEGRRARFKRAAQSGKECETRSFRFVFLCWRKGKRRRESKRMCVAGKSRRGAVVLWCLCPEPRPRIGRLDTVKVVVESAFSGGWDRLTNGRMGAIGITAMRLGLG